jgi:hypothetical protein
MCNIPRFRIPFEGGVRTFSIEIRTKAGAPRTVVDEDRDCAYLYIVGVEAGDGEVVYSWMSCLACDLDDATCLATGGA